MDKAWAKEQLEDFLYASAQIKRPSKYDRSIRQMRARPKANELAHVVDKILDQVIPGWRADGPDADPDFRWLRSQVTRGKVEIERGDEIRERLGIPTVAPSRQGETAEGPAGQREVTVERPTGRPRVFIGSSSEGLGVANAFKVALERACECDVVVWNEEVFRPGDYALDRLIEIAASFDFAVLVATSDDEGTVRGKPRLMPRDNVLLELGLFMGVLGRQRAYVLSPKLDAPTLPTDLLGVTILTPYRVRAGSPLSSALTAAVQEMTEAVGRLGLRSGVPALHLATPETATTSDAPTPTPAAPAIVDAGATVDHAAELQRELVLLTSNATAQGWKVRVTDSAVRITSPKGARYSQALPTNQLEARRVLRPFLDDLRAHGLRVNSHLRESVVE